MFPYDGTCLCASFGDWTLAARISSVAKLCMFKEVSD
jgi:hypothetical protein